MKHYLQLYFNSYRGLSKPAWMLALIMLINRSGAMVIPFLGVYMTTALHFSLRDTGNVLTCFGIGAVIGSALGGWLSDKVGNFRVQLLCLLFSVPVFCILPVLNTPLQLGIGVFTLSIITEAFRPANSVSIASYTSPENITKAFSLNRMAINLGFSIGPALGGFLATISYSWLFYGNALSSCLAGFFFYFYFRRLQPRKKTRKTDESEIRGEHSPWKDKYFLIFCFFCLLYSVCFFQLLNTLPLFYRTVHHLSEWSIGIIIAYSGFVVFSLEMILVHLAERRLGGKNAIILGTLLVGAAFLVLLLPGNLLLLYFGMFLLCISEILAMPFMSTITMKRASNQKGAYMGVHSLAFSAAHVISPFVGTRIADRFGFDVLWLLTGFISIISAFGFYWIIRKLKT